MFRILIVFLFFILPANSIAEDSSSHQAKIEFRVVDDYKAKSSLQRPMPTGEVTYLYTEVSLTREDIDKIKVVYNPGSGYGIHIILTPEGKEKFAKVTTQHVGRKFAFLIDDKIISAPTIMEPILGGEAQIMGQFTKEQAISYAKQISPDADISLAGQPTPEKK